MPRNITIKNMAEVMAAKAARPAVMRPQKVNGTWRDPKMSGMDIARLRKSYLRQGKEWKWDIPHKIVEKKVPFKGHKRDLRRLEKEEEIKRCMARMPKLIAEYRAREKKRRAERAVVGISGLAKLLDTPREFEAVITRR